MEVKNAPYMTSTDNISTAMRQAGIKFGVVIDKIDFNLQKVTTFIRDKRTRTSSQVPTLTREELVNPFFLLTQTYDIILREKKEESIFPDVLFANNSAHTTGYLVIKRNQDLKLNSFSREDFLAHLEGVLLRHGCFIRVNNSNVLEEAINRMYDTYQAKKPITEDIKIKAIDFPSPIKPVADSLDMLYKKGNNELESTKDKKNKIKLASAKQDSILIQYNKVTKGIMGRTYDGHIITVREIKPNHIPNFNIDARTVRKEETSEFIHYIAKETGFVFFENKLLRIDNQTEMHSANIRNKDKLVTELDDGVAINIKSKDKLSDAVGGNINIRSDQVNINGNVGPSATVEGNLVKIGGQTHSKSKIKAKKAHISIHKGELKGDDILVDRLEGGSILAKNIRVKVARGGHIKGENIIIDNLESNVEIIASRRIQIKNITGESNVFILKPAGYFIGNEGEEISLESLMDEKDILEDEINKKDKTLKEKIFLIEFNEKSLETQRDDKIDKLRYNIKSSKAMTNKLNSYVKLQEEKDELESDLQKYKKKLKRICLQIQKIHDGAENAFMEMNTEWTGGNSVHIYHHGKAYNFYPTDSMIKSPISFEILKKEKLI